MLALLLMFQKLKFLQVLVKLEAWNLVIGLVVVQVVIVLLVITI